MITSAQLYTVAKSARATDLLLCRLGFAIGMVTLGAVNWSFGTFALQFQPVPTALATWLSPEVSAALLIILGLGLTIRSVASAAAALLSLWLAIWVFVLHPIAIPWERVTIGHMLPASEVLACACGVGFLHAAMARARWRASILLILLALAHVVFGICHFYYLEITAGMVPESLPGRTALAIATGIAHLAAAISLVTRFQLRHAATLLSAMYLGFLALVCVPLLLKQSSQQLPWLMCLITWLCAASAWVVRSFAAELSSSLTPHVQSLGALTAVLLRKGATK